MSWRKELGDVGERAVDRQLRARGWIVTDLNTGIGEKNVDLIAMKAGLTVHIQVKTYNNYGWISGGGVNPEVCAGGPIFNRAKNARYRCTHLVCVTPASPGNKKEIRDDWRFFVIPVEDAERLFRVNVDGYYNTPKLNLITPTCPPFCHEGPISRSSVADRRRRWWHATRCSSRRG